MNLGVEDILILGNDDAGSLWERTTALSPVATRTGRLVAGIMSENWWALTSTALSATPILTARSLERLFRRRPGGRQPRQHYKQLLFNRFCRRQ